MKFIKWRSLFITCIICLLPILLGIALWNELPDTMAIHFNLYNEADNFATKTFAVFGLPILMSILQMISCFIYDINAYKHGKCKKFKRVIKWIVPFLSVVLQTITLGYALGWNMDIRKSVALIIGVMFLILGNYLPKLDYINNYNVDTEKARKINRFIGYETVIMGALVLITIFLPPVATGIWIVLLIPYAVVSVIYGIKIGRNN